MKKFSKILAVALAVLMLMMTSVTAFADYADMPLDEHLAIGQLGDEVEVHTFVAPSEGWYVLNTFTYDEWTDPYIVVYDEYSSDEEDCVIIAYADDSITSQFNCELWFYAEADKTYYIEFGNYNDEYVEYEVYLEAENENSHIYCWDYSYDGHCDYCDELYCECNCHQGGIVGFFWRIGNFFNRLFRINEWCECGSAHW